MAHDDFMPIEGWDHVELWVGNAKQSAYFYEHAMGFTPVAYAGPETGVRDRASYVLEQGHIRFVVTSGLRADSEIARFCHAHGDGVKDVALTVPDATEAYRQAVQRGGVSVTEPHWVEDEHGRVELATIGTYGETVHTFVNRSECGGRYLPGYEPLTENGATGKGVGLRAIDHVVGNVELGRMNHWVEYYEKTMGMTEMLHFSDEDISTEYSALMSKVMTGGHGKIKFPINEPAEGRRKSQIEEYLDFFGGPGVQHVALLTADIVATVDELRSRGVRFLDTPDDVLRRGRVARGRDRQELGRGPAAEDPRRPRRRRLPAPDLLETRPGPADDVLRGDRAARRARLRPGQLQGAVRGHRARTGPPRQPLGAMPPRTQYARSGEIELAYQVFGDGDHDVVLVLDWASHLESLWEQPLMVDFLTSLGRFARVLWFDMRGIGMSDPVPGGASAPEDWVDDVTAVMDAAGFQRASVIAQGHAVQRALLAAATHPERIESLVLYNGFARLARADDYPAGIPESAQAAVLDGIEQTWGTGALATALAPSVADRPGVIEWWGRVERFAGTPRTALAKARAIYELDLRHVLPLVAVPTLVIQSRDNMYVRADHGRYLAAHIAGARLLELESADHWPLPDPELLGAIEEFVTGERREIQRYGSRAGHSAFHGRRWLDTAGQ